VIIKYVQFIIVSRVVFSNKFQLHLFQYRPTNNPEVPAQTNPLLWMLECNENNRNNKIATVPSLAIMAVACGTQAATYKYHKKNPVLLGCTTFNINQRNTKTGNLT